MKKIFLLFLILSLSAVSCDAQITGGEYFFDTATQVGAANPINLNSGNAISGSFNVSINSLSTGFHTLYFRVKNAQGVWSHYEGRLFYIMPYPVSTSDSIVSGEWFIDTDPGINNATPFIVNSGNNVNTSLAIPTGMLSDGFHSLHIRVKDNNGKWSHYEGRMFYVFSAPNFLNTHIVTGEWFIDTDPGPGNGAPINLQPGNNINASIALSIPNLSAGDHVLFIRVFDNNARWSHYAMSTFHLCTSLPLVNLNIASGDTVCINNGPVILQGYPSGGLFGGVNVSDSLFTPTQTGLFPVNYTVTDANSCSNTAYDTIVVIDTSSCYITGVNNNHKINSDFRIFPNPSQGIINIVSSNSGLFSIKIYSMFSEMVFYMKSAKELVTIDLSHLPKGCYSVEIIDEFSSNRKSIILI